MLVVTNVGAAKISIAIDACYVFPEGSASVVVEPKELILKKVWPPAPSVYVCRIASFYASFVASSQGQSTPVQVAVTILRPGAVVSFCVSLAVAGGCTVFAVGQALAERAVFGVPLKILEFSPSNGFNVPKPLAVLRDVLFSEDRVNEVRCMSLTAYPCVCSPVPQVFLPVSEYVPAFVFLSQEGVFRVSADAMEVKRVKSQLNRGDYGIVCSGKCAAQLIKVGSRR